MPSSAVSPDDFPQEPAAALMSSSPEGAAGGRSTLIGAIMASSAAVMWGTNGVVSHVLFQAGVTPLTLVEARSMITAAGMGGFLLIAARSRLRLRWRVLPMLLLFGVSLAIVTYSYFLAIKLLPVAVAVMIQYTGPTLIALYSALVMRRMPSRRIWLALALTLVGVALLAGLGSLLTGGTAAKGVTLLGVLVSFGSAIAMAFYILMGERLGKRVHPQTNVVYGFGIASLIWLAFQPPWRFQTLALQPANLPLVLTVGIIGTLVPFGLFLSAVRRLDATRAAIISTVEPVTAALISWWLLGEGLDPWQILGSALVLVGVTIVQLKRA
jgi:drug/metabolite transporter (DMT)-like permease